MVLGPPCDLVEVELIDYLLGAEESVTAADELIFATEQVGHRLAER